MIRCTPVDGKPPNLPLQLGWTGGVGSLLVADRCRAAAAKLPVQERHERLRDRVGPEEIHEGCRSESSRIYCSSGTSTEPGQIGEAVVLGIPVVILGQ